MKFLFACICFAAVAYINAKPSSYSSYSAPAPYGSSHRLSYEHAPAAYAPAHRPSYHHAPAYAPVYAPAHSSASASAAASASASSRGHYSQYVVPTYEVYGSGLHAHHYGY